MDQYDLRTLRRSLGLTQHRAAQAMGVSLRQYIRYEHGQSPVPHNAAGALLPVRPDAPRAPKRRKRDPYAEIRYHAPEPVVEYLPWNPAWGPKPQD
jgi:hypothetical protein